MKVKLTSSHKVSSRNNGVTSEHFSSVSLELDMPGDASPETNAQILRQKSLLDLEAIYTSAMGAGAPLSWVQQELKRFADWSKGRIEKVQEGSTGLIVVEEKPHD